MKFTDRLRRIALVILVVILGVTFGIPATADAPIGLVVDGRVVQMDVAPVVVDGRVMVPARFVAEALGARVGWDADGRNVVIISKEAKAAASLSPSVEAEELIAIRSLAEQGVVVTSGPDAYTRLRKGDAVVTITKLPTQDNPQTDAQVSGSQVTSVPIIFYHDQTHLRIEDARLLGFIP